MNLDYFFSGLDTLSYKYMGCHKLGDGVEFYLWAPHAKEVEICLKRENEVLSYQLHKTDNRGIWHLIIEKCSFDYVYKYRIKTQDNSIIEKADPYAFYTDRYNPTYSVMYDLNNYHFTDRKYMDNRTFDYNSMLNIYEVHINGFKHKDGKTSYRQLKEDLIPYVKQMGYTHIELLPVIEYPFDGSWGYQATGFFSSTNRYGHPAELMDFINECHLNNIGVILDCSTYHFAVDKYALSLFDGQACYENNDPKLLKSPWGSYRFDLSSGPVISFLMSFVNMFINEYHFDGIRMDAVSYLIFNDGERINGFNESGLSFIKRLNYTIKSQHPDVILIAEDSSDYEGVTRPTDQDGLGFDYKWDLGWMNDTLRYYQSPDEMRSFSHNQITFSMAYFYKEHYILPFSHDEVVHGKNTILNKMYGKYEDKFSQCRNLFVYMFTHPGKKLNFLGNDIGMFREFDEHRELDWELLKYPIHDSFWHFFKDIMNIYSSYKAFYAYDYDDFSFKWIDADNYRQSIYTYVRYDEDNCFVIVLNMQKKAYTNFRIGVPIEGTYSEIINTDKDIYSGSNMCNIKPIRSQKIKAHGLPNSIAIDLAPYAGIIFSIKLKKKAVSLEEPDMYLSFECRQ